MRSDTHIEIEVLDQEIIDSPVLKSKNLKTDKKQSVLTGFFASLVFYWFSLRDLVIISSFYSSPFKGIQVVRKTISLFKTVPGAFHTKYVKIDGKYWRGYYIPGWRTPMQKQFLSTKANLIIPHRKVTSRLLNVYFSVTKRCLLNCVHCSDWDNINSGKDLSLKELNLITAKLIDLGIVAIHFTGGEPMTRVGELTKLINEYRGQSLFYILTSGYNFTAENARRLKTNGLTGVSVSLDHYIEDLHDAFRGKNGTFQLARQAIRNAIEYDLIAILSLCITKKTATKEFLFSYMELAKEWGVAFVQILEPRPVGKYKNKDVQLSGEQIKLIENFFKTFNKRKEFKDYPIVVYHENYMRRTGCLASGKTALYIDAEGDIRSCPFCSKRSGNALKDDIAEMADKLSERGCSSFRTE